MLGAAPDGSPVYLGTLRNDLAYPAGEALKVEGADGAANSRDLHLALPPSGFDAGGHVIPPLQEYAEAARQSAQESNVPFIDLNTMSKTLYEAPGPEGSKAAFAGPAPGRLDNPHHDNYGSHELAAAFAVPRSPHRTSRRPLGDDAHKEVRQ